jgi:hypothetical protein
MTTSRTFSTCGRSSNGSCKASMIGHGASLNGVSTPEGSCAEPTAGHANEDALTITRPDVATEPAPRLNPRIADLLGTTGRRPLSPGQWRDRDADAATLRARSCRLQPSGGRQVCLSTPQVLVAQSAAPGPSREGPPRVLNRLPKPALSRSCGSRRSSPGARRAASAHGKPVGRDVCEGRSYDTADRAPRQRPKARARGWHGQRAPGMGGFSGRSPVQRRTVTPPPLPSVT